MHNSDPFIKPDDPAWWALTGEQQAFATGAIGLYEYVGFTKRRMISFWQPEYKTTL